jgi:hypothetical protein
MVTKNERGGEEHSNSASVYGIVAIGFFLNLYVPFLSKSEYFRFRLLQLLK